MRAKFVIFILVGFYAFSLSPWRITQSNPSEEELINRLYQQNNDPAEAESSPGSETSGNDEVLANEEPPSEDPVEPTLPEPVTENEEDMIEVNLADAGLFETIDGLAGLAGLVLLTTEQELANQLLGPGGNPEDLPRLTESFGLVSPRVVLNAILTNNNLQLKQDGDGYVISVRAAQLPIDAGSETTAEESEGDSEDTASNSQEEEEPDPSEMLINISIDNAELMKAIDGLAAGAGMNIIFDPKVVEGPIGPAGTPVPFSPVTVEFIEVTARDAMDTILELNGLMLKENPKTRINLVSFKPAPGQEPLVTTVIDLQYANATNVADVVTITFGESRNTISAIPGTSKLLARTIESEVEDMRNLVKMMDLQPKQVLISAKIIETSKKPSSIKGIDWSGTLSAQNIKFGNGFTSFQQSIIKPGIPSTFTTPGGRDITVTPNASQSSTRNSTFSPLSTVPGFSLDTARGFDQNTAFLSADGVSVVLSFLEEDADSKVVAEPREVVMNNYPARLSVTRSFPIFEITPGTENTPPTAVITYTNVGTTIDVLPRITSNDNIIMNITNEVSNIDGVDTQILNGAQNTANIYAIRKLNTLVMVKTGNTLVMGGMTSDIKTTATKRVPILGKMPFFGRLFRHDAKEQNHANLLIFITPTIIDENLHFHTDETENKILEIAPNDPIPNRLVEENREFWSDDGNSNVWWNRRKKADNQEESNE
ncbi:MAG TPA: type II secretion system protein GspD [Verrucomicrobia bacterium]|nr:type II secretion system protein GspD [Verrucomicrobiota bacterium]